MRKQIYYALAGLLLGTTVFPEHSSAESFTAPAPAAPTLKAASADRVEGLKKRKKRKKNRPAWRRRR
ncbi:hypothetical protein [Hymenobacter sp. CRA2]|uniref:hypothetical protein n=1 Tax=Hymenobacter sp. CRA2 TaxID=1955620 RepID=UPI00098F71AF|nr:hypothetical protein [Hymenobacter sp. CRA2]OON68193.1 hypothetical protein B0919_13610 [Hymenobacter sp. CRA2]